MLPIAIIGLSCRFPGAPDAAAFWQLLRRGGNAVREVPPERWDSAELFDARRTTRGKMSTRWGGFLDQLDHFDASFFGISPAEAHGIDPQQRLLLETAWEAIDDAGQTLEYLASVRTGVFVGIGPGDYGRLAMKDPALIDPFTNTGNFLSIAAGRISYVFDFKGPSLAIDTACSSSLVAVHYACQSILNDECDVALAGGVNAILSPEITIGLSKSGAMSADGACKAFDARANGYVRAEGAGVVLLKPLDRAIADNDPIYAVIRGSAVNQNGRTNGLTAPNTHGQEEVLRRACLRAGVAPEQIQYVEAHGTGTVLGDLIEAKALAAVYGQERPSASPCLIGSVKTNLGHLETAAGIAGLIKLALSLKQGEIPPSLHFEQPNPHIPFADYRLQVVTSLQPWRQTPTPALAAISSFGFGGTNAHMVLEAYRSETEVRGDSETDARVYLLPISARSPEALRSLVGEYRRFLMTPGVAESISLRDLCYTASLRRTHHNHRAAFVFRSLDGLLEQLDAFGRGESFAVEASAGRKSTSRRRKLSFIFPSRVEVSAAVIQQLMEREPLVREILCECDEIVRRETQRSFLSELPTQDLHALAAQEPQFSFVSDELAEPALFALQVALATLWRSWGIVPDALCGHGVGEVAAMSFAGAFNLEEAIHIILNREGLAGEALAGAANVDAERAWQTGDRGVAAFPSQHTAAVACAQRAGGTVNDTLLYEPEVSGLKTARRAATRTHSSLPVFLSSTGGVSVGEDFDPLRWLVRFRDGRHVDEAIRAMDAAGYDTYLALGTLATTSDEFSQHLNECSPAAVVLPSLGGGEEASITLRESLAKFYVSGSKIDWRKLFPQGGRYLTLPNYPWQRKRFWLRSPAAAPDSHAGPA